MFFGFGLFLAFFAQEFLSISAVRFLCSAHLQFVRCLAGKKWMPEVTSTLRASAPVCCVSHFAPNQDRPPRRPLPSPQRIIALVRSGKWNWVHVFEPQQYANRSALNALVFSLFWVSVARRFFTRELPCGLWTSR